MRIVLDLQSLQSESRLRGIGRYTRCLLRALYQQAPEHEYVLLFNAGLSSTLNGAIDEAKKLVPGAVCVIFDYPGDASHHKPSHELYRQLAEAIRGQFIANLEPDLVHVFSLFEGYSENVVTTIERGVADFAVTATFYDLIPLLNPTEYLDHNPRFKDYYLRKVDALVKADRLLAISNFSARECADHLSFPESHICVGPLGPMQAHSANEGREASDLAKLMSMGLEPGFILYVGASDSRKNLPRLVEAWAGLPESIQSQHSLVMAGSMPESDMNTMRQLASRRSSHPDSLIFLGHVSDEQLEALYHQCRVFVFPSWHEGFGLPPLEAMLAGCAVISSNTSSLPEVVGMAEAMFDPLDVDDIRGRLHQALTDDDFRSRLIAHAPIQAAKFSWSHTASAALDMWQQACVSKNSDSFDEETTNPDEWVVTLQQRLEEHYDQLVALLRNRDPAEVRPVLPALAQSLARNETELKRFHAALSYSLEPWRVEGPFDSSYSLALLNREFARGLHSNGMEVVMHSTEGPGDFEPAAEFLDRNADIAEWHGREAQWPHEMCGIVSRNMYPPRVNDMQGLRNGLHCYGWEESEFPGDWVSAFNEHIQFVTTMSDFVSRTLINSGVTVPVTTVGLGADHWLRIEPAADFALNEPLKGFVFLHISSCFPRKGVDVLLEAYGHGFTADDDVSLVIKTFPNPHNTVHQQISDMREKFASYPHVVLLEENLSDEQLKALMALGDALVAPSRGEGFGLPMAEAMLDELPVITTGYGGQMEFCSPETAWLVDFNFAAAETHFALSNSVWAEPDAGHLAQQMLAVFGAPESERCERPRLGKKLLLEQFTWRATAARAISAAAQASSALAEPGNQSPRVAWISTWNTRCGIAGYSQFLVPHLGLPVTVYAPDLTDADKSDLALCTADTKDVVRCWSNTGADDLSRLGAGLREEAPDAVVIQFNYGFFDFTALARLVREQKMAQRRVYMVLHATVDPVDQPNRKLSLVKDALAMCDRLLVHSVADLNRLKALGMVENAAILPHGVLEWPSAGADRKPWPKLAAERPLELMSFGFFLPHKGLLQLVEASALLRERGVNIRLTMMNAEYPADASRQAIAVVKQRIRDLGLADIVVMDTAFYEDEECLERLAAADLVVFPYQDTGESSSAAVRQALASGAPVAVTPLEIFRDVNQAVTRLTGCTPELLAESIEQLLAIDADAWQVWRSRAARWRAAHHHSVVASRLAGMLRALHQG